MGQDLGPFAQNVSYNPGPIVVEASKLEFEVSCSFLLGLSLAAAQLLASLLHSHAGYEDQSRTLAPSEPPAIMLMRVSARCCLSCQQQACRLHKTSRSACAEHVPASAGQLAAPDLHPVRCFVGQCAAE